MNQEGLSFSHGQVLLIGDVSLSQEGQSVRTFGRLKEYHPTKNQIRIEYKNQVLLVDIGHLATFPYKMNTLLQCIGEIESYTSNLEDPETKILRARVVRNVDGLDTALYEKALKIRNSFLET
eukprot:TRINITY_DN8714_c0_g1_i1.p2 TRINITY_DN8714_c0_g1~~TRINITY_DN8714_c0_g1_i1.p2  ORF type:complete len:122 (+),score=17.32 TRINITY_DN8714_c0_g1_i1:2-367(+)